MLKKSVTIKLILQLSIILILMVAMMITASSIEFATFNDSLVSEKLELSASVLKKDLAELQLKSFTAASVASHDIELIKVIKTKDADDIIKLLTQSMKLFTVDYFTVFDENGGFLASTYEYPNTDNARLTTKHVDDALNGKISTYYEENNEMKVSVCSGAPIYDSDGELIGVISTGIRLDTNAFVDNIKSVHSVEATIFLGDVRHSTTIVQNGERVVGTKLNQDIAKIVIGNKREYYGEADILGVKYKTVYIPLVNAENKAFAIIFMGISTQNVMVRTNEFIRGNTIIGVISILAVGFLFAFIITRTIKPLTKLTGVLEEVAEGNLNIQIEVKSNDEIGRLSAALRNVVNALRILLDDVNIMVDEREKGNIDFFIDSSKYHGGYKRLADDIFKLINTSHTDTMMLLNMLEELNKGNFDADIPVLPGKKIIMNQKIDEIKNNMKKISNEIEHLTKHAINGNFSARVDSSAYRGDWEKIIEGLNELLGVVAKPINEVITVLTEVSKGNFDVYVKGDYDGDFYAIKLSLNTTIINISEYIKEISAVLNGLANNDLEQEITRDYVGEFISIKDSLNNIIGKLNEVMKGINAAAGQVAASARQLSESSSNLAEGAAEQAASVEELSATVLTVNEKTEINALNSSKAKELSNQSYKSANAGSKEMERMLAAMDDIKQAAGDISKIIKKIDDIALQTNLLALNAAVEAARAGEHGKGFAIVSAEVRSLAEKSKIAAKETTDLIESSIKKTNEGMEIAAKMSENIDEIVSSVAVVSNIISEISDASNEQAAATTQISQGINQISDVVQTNAATSEESAAASQELSSQSEVLKNMIQMFKLKRF